MNSASPLKIIFMGTPDFAVPALEILHDSVHRIQAVVTVPDKQQGRGRRVQGSAVKKTAESLGIPTLQPTGLTDPTFVQQITSFAPDVIVVVAFQILPEVVYTIPNLGSFNLHASLLPKYRGAAPIHWALLNGDTETGVTTFFLKRKVDTGNIIAQHGIVIDPDDNLHSLYAKLCALGAELVLDTVNLIAAGEITAGEQDNSLATPAPKVTSNTQRLNFEESAVQCHNRVRAFAPAPGAFTFRDGSRIKILSTSLADLSGDPGSIIDISESTFTVACGTGALLIKLVQPESKKSMDTAAYLRGNPLKIGDYFG